MRQIFLDTETTGLSPESGDRIIEIGCIEMLDRRLSGRNLHLYVNPHRPSHEDALKVHGLTEEFLSTQPPFAAVVDELLEFVDGADEIVIHNASFDVGFLNEELRRLGRPRFAPCVVDSLAMARDLYPGKSNSLDALCRRLEVDNSGRQFHGALLDAGLLAEVYLCMTRGQNSLAIDAGEPTAAQVALEAVDFASFDLLVIEADDDEARAHASMLADLDKASGGKTVWRRLESVLLASTAASAPGPVATEAPEQAAMA